MKLIQELAERFALLEAELKQVKAQLKSTEQAYDMALDQNLKLQKKVDTMNKVRIFPVLPTTPESEDIVDEMFMEASKLAKKNQTMPEDDVESTLIKGWKGDMIILDDPVASKALPDLEAAKEWYTSIAPGRRRADAEVVVIPGRNPEKELLELRVSKAQGDRAKMKDTLQRSQHANRRYKARLKRQKTQLEALWDVADAAFPLYKTLTRSIEYSKPDDLLDCLVAPVPVVRHNCNEFHNKFNQAAETFTK